MGVIEITCDILSLKFFYREAVNKNTLWDVGDVGHEMEKKSHKRYCAKKIITR